MRKHFFQIMCSISLYFTSVYTANAQWVQTNASNEEPRGVIEKIVAIDNILLAVTMKNGTFLSTDDGANWIDFMGITDVAGIAASGNIIYLWSDDGGVFITTDNGTSWNPANHGFPAGEKIQSIVTSGSNVFMAANQHIYHTTVNDTSWMEINSSHPAGVRQLAASGDTIFAGTVSDNGSLAHVFYSTDECSNWTEIDTGCPLNFSAMELAVSGSHVFVASAKSVFHSSINGTGWFTSDSGLVAPILFIEAFAAYRGTAFISCDGSGIFRSVDYGRSWTPVNEGFVDTIFGNTNNDFHSLAVCGDNLFAGSVNGSIWRRPLSEMLGSVRTRQTRDKKKQLHSEVILIDYRNNEIVMKFSHPQSGPVTVKMFDMGGRQISSHFNKILNSGTHRYSFDAHALARGCYIVQLQTDANTCMKHVQIVE